MTDSTPTSADANPNRRETAETHEIAPSRNFIGRQIDADLAAGKHDAIVTRFPPEPNGYLHIGHAKSIWLNFGLASEYGGACTLRFDDTNPAREDAKFIAAIQQDLRWLGYRWSRLAYASDYFAQLYDLAVQLIKKQRAYVDPQSNAEIRAQRGTLTTLGANSPYRDRPVAENLALFAAMKNGDFVDGEMVLRARIDMASPNLNLRDPILYRILHHHHARSGDQWCIYPLYDFAHGQGDALEGVTHSLCTLEFEDHRALYDWLLDNLTLPARPRQIEFSRLNLNYTVMSKRLLAQLVDHGDVDGWDDPRMPTLCGLRRRGFTPDSIRRFISLVGVTRSHNMIEMGALENCVRQELEPIAPRVMAVINPLKLVLENYPEGDSELLEVPNHPQNTNFGTRKITLSRELYIERDDFMEAPPRKFFRLAPGREVRLRYAFVVQCCSVVKDAHGQVVEVRCRYDPATRHGKQPQGDGRKVKGIIHWVNAEDAAPAEVRLYDRLFSCANPLADKDAEFRKFLNPESLLTRKHAMLEASMSAADSKTRYQFERLGYFFMERARVGAEPKLIFNRIVTLRDSWAATAARPSRQAK